MGVRVLGCMLVGCGYMLVLGRCYRVFRLLVGCYQSGAKAAISVVIGLIFGEGTWAAITLGYWADTRGITIG